MLYTPVLPRNSAMLFVTVHDNTTWEFYWWILGFERLARTGAIALRFARGRRSPIPHDVGGWGSLTFTVEGSGLPARSAFSSCVTDSRS